MLKSICSFLTLSFLYVSSNAQIWVSGVINCTDHTTTVVLLNHTNFLVRGGYLICSDINKNGKVDNIDAMLGFRLPHPLSPGEEEVNEPLPIQDKDMKHDLLIFASFRWKGGNKDTIFKINSCNRKE